MDYHESPNHRVRLSWCREAIATYSANFPDAAHNCADVFQLTGKDRYGLITVDGQPLRLEDCHYRMLTVEEIRRAMAFGDGYVLHGTKRDRVAQLGSAVTPPVMRLRTSRIVESLT